MSGLYLTDLADVLRRFGLPVIEVDGWQSRARGSGGYSSGRPTHVMVHHTASGASSDGWPDVNYCTFSSENAPVCNLYLDRSGTVYVCAAGATNTNGSGGPIDNVPADSMNSYAIGIEAGNNGTGEPWPPAQQAAYIQMCNALCEGYGLPHVRAHVEWAPGRKVDPAGPSQWSPAGGTWDMEAFRLSMIGPVPAPHPEEGPEMLTMFAVTDASNASATYVSNGMTYRWLSSEDAIAALTVFMVKAGLDPAVQGCTKAQIGWAGQYLDNGVPADNPYL